MAKAAFGSPDFMEDRAMSSFNVFGWIREGVRQSVLLGVTDALEQIGTPSDADDVKPRLLDLARRSEALPMPDSTPTPPRGESKPKRLGRSLRDMETG
jgi:hypothetical protein